MQFASVGIVGSTTLGFHPSNGTTRILLKSHVNIGVVVIVRSGGRQVRKRKEKKMELMFELIWMVSSHGRVHRVYGDGRSILDVYNLLVER